MLNEFIFTQGPRTNQFVSHTNALVGNSLGIQHNWKNVGGHAKQYTMSEVDNDEVKKGSEQEAIWTQEFQGTEISSEQRGPLQITNNIIET